MGNLTHFTITVGRGGGGRGGWEIIVQSMGIFIKIGSFPLFRQSLVQVCWTKIYIRPSFQRKKHVCISVWRLENFGNELNIAISQTMLCWILSQQSVLASPTCASFTEKSLKRQLQCSPLTSYSSTVTYRPGSRSNGSSTSPAVPFLLTLSTVI